VAWQPFSKTIGITASWCYKYVTKYMFLGALRANLLPLSSSCWFPWVLSRFIETLSQPLKMPFPFSWGFAF
jgi:hypothetical protein